MFEKVASIREFHASPPPLKKIRTAPFLELAYVKRNRRLTEVENFGGAREILQPRAFQKNLEPVRLHQSIYYSHRSVCRNY